MPAYRNRSIALHWLVLASLLVSSLAGVITPTQAALAADTPSPTSVTIAGSLQDEAGCAGDWDPACDASKLAYDAGDDVWQAGFALPAGSFEV
ncbi:MAG: hypothetical protein IPK16_17420 [Anaerolineales bacterium]|nr:hypothetical protein [Anaerolineales bacterium]